MNQIKKRMREHAFFVAFIYFLMFKSHGAMWQ